MTARIGKKASRTRPRTSTPVSYTHLDVYKRQVYAAVSFVFDAALLALSTIALVGSTYNAFLYFRF